MNKNPSKKFNLSKAGQIVKLKQGNNSYEIVTQRGKVTEYRQGIETDVNNVLTSDTVFFDARKGNVASEDMVKNAFNLDSIKACLVHLLKNGTLEKSTEERKAEMDQKTKEICYYINQNYVEPKTKLPHPIERLRQCMSDVNYRVDVTVDTKRQAEAAVKKMRGTLMFTELEALSGKLTVHVSLANQVEGIIRSFGCRKSEYSATDATFEFSMSQAQFNSLTDGLNKKISGNYSLKIDQGGVAPEPTTKKSKGKKKKGRK